jgi:sugar lactone lactonase YvrE
MSERTAMKGVCAAAGAAALLALAGCMTAEGPVEKAVVWKTFAGQPGGLGNVDGAGASARFCQPCAVACDAAGNAYVADYYNYVIRKVAPDGQVTTLAGCVGEPGFSDGVGSAARFDRPAGLCVDAAGSLYVADSGNHTVRKVTADGAVTTVAGRAGDAGCADGGGREARFRSPLDVAADGAGNIYVADTGNQLVRRLSAAGAVTTLAGKLEWANGAAVGGYADGKGSAARFRSPRGLAADGAGNLFVADSENAVLRKISADGTVRTLAGLAGSAGFANGTNAAARFSYPQGLGVDAAGNLYVADTGNLVIRRVTPAGSVSTVTNGAARFPMPRDVAVDRRGNVLVADNDSQTISVIAPRGGATVLAGSASRHGAAEGRATEARFSRPWGLAEDGKGGLVVADNFNHALRRIGPDGVVTTLCGKAGSSGSSDGAGGAARFFWPAGLARDRAGALYVADSGNHTVRRVAADGSVATLAGSAGSAGGADGTADKARFSCPSDVACDGFGGLVVADRANHAIRRISGAGAVTTLAGRLGQAGRANGAGGAALFNSPSGVAVDALGNVYVADTGNHAVRKITPAGEVSTLAGCAGIRGAADGRGAFARFNGPSDVEVDEAGDVYVADRDNHLIRRISADGTVVTVGGYPNAMTCAEGVACESRFAQPTALAFINGTLYVADACNNRIAEGRPCRLARSIRMLGAPRAAEPAAEPAAARVLDYRWEVFAGQPGRPGVSDGSRGGARLSGPQGLAFAPDGALFVADSRAGLIRCVSADGAVRTLGMTNRLMRSPVALACAAGGLLVVDGGKMVWRAGAGGDVKRLSGDSLRARFVSGVAPDGAGGAVLADANAHILWRLGADGSASVLAGRAGQAGTVDGVGAAALLDEPVAVAADGRGGFWVACAGGGLRRVSAEGAVSTVAEAVSFGRLDGLAVDGAGFAYVADRGRHVIWKVATDGRVEKLGGSEQAMGGSGWLVTGLAVGRDGAVYVADAARNCVMRGAPVR